MVNPSAGAPRLLEIIDAFESEHPKCRVELVQLPLRDRLGPLRRGEVAAVMARVPLDSPDVVVGPVLTRDVPALAVARGHPLAGRANVTLEDVADNVICDLDQMPAEIGGERVPATAPSGRVIRRHPTRLDTLTELTLLVARGQAVHPTIAWLDAGKRLVPTIVIHPDVVHVPIADLPRTRYRDLLAPEQPGPAARRTRAAGPRRPHRSARSEARLSVKVSPVVHPLSALGFQNMLQRPEVISLSGSGLGSGRLWCRAGG